MILSAIMKLDAGGFTTPMGRVTQGLQTVIRLSADLGDKLTGAFDLGGAISDLAAQTGELPGTVKVLQQAFDDTGVGADKTGQILNIMRKNLAALSDDGSATTKTFKRLGLSIDELKNMSATDQLEAIGSAIMGLSTPAERSAAAMEIFGRSGASMLTFFADSGALDTAKASLGGLPALLDNNANAFDGVSDALTRIKSKSAGLWAGIAEGALPAAQAITDAMDGIDLTGIGQEIGRVLGTAVELFRSAPLGDLLKDGLVVGLGEAVNGIASMFTWLSNELWTALSTPISYLSAAFGKVIQEIMELIGKIPKVGKMLGLDGFKAEGFDEIREQAKSDLVDFFDIDTNVKLVDTSAEKARLAAAWTGAADIYKTKLADIQDEANAAAAAGSALGTNQLEVEAAAAKGGGGSIATDQLARIGGYTGGNTGRTIALAEQTLGVNKQMLSVLTSIGRKSKQVAVWGV